MAVYLDLVLLLNFAVDLMLLLGADRLCGHSGGLRRCALAAGLGSAYSALCLLRPLEFLSGNFGRLAVLVTMSIVAFGFDRRAIRRGGLFVLLSLALGGGAMLSGGGALSVLLIAAGLCWLCHRLLGRRSGQEFVPVYLTYRGRAERFFALMDTGNTLKDPMTGGAVLVVSPKVAMRLLDLTEEALRDPVVTVVSSGIQGLRLIPYRAVGSSGMLLAKEFENVQIGSERGRRLVAFSPNAFGCGGEYQALTGGI